MAWEGIIETKDDAIRALDRAWPSIVADSRQVLGSELHYQAMLYHALRTHGAPVRQIGMNVKQFITDVRSETFLRLEQKRHVDFRGGFEPIPDIVLFRSSVDGDWRRRRAAHTLEHMILAIEVKASERAKGRLRAGEICTDIEKLDAHRQEARHRGFDFHPVMMVVDTAPDPNERMTSFSKKTALERAQALRIEWRYFDPESEEVVRAD